jgi:hypothetical protein
MSSSLYFLVLAENVTKGKIRYIVLAPGHHLNARAIRIIITTMVFKEQVVFVVQRFGMESDYT